MFGRTSDVIHLRKYNVAIYAVGVFLVRFIIVYTSEEYVLPSILTLTIQPAYILALHVHSPRRLLRRQTSSLVCLLLHRLHRAHSPTNHNIPLAEISYLPQLVSA